MEEIIVSVDTGRRIICPICGKTLEFRHRTKGKKIMKHELIEIN